LLIESSVCRYAPPRSWRGSKASAGTILHDWGAHLVDQALQLGLGPCRRLTAWLTEAPWEAVDSGGHGRIVLEFDGVQFQVESSRVCKLDRPRWWIIGTGGGFVKHGIDPQETPLRAGDIDAASEPVAHQGLMRGSSSDGSVCEEPVPTIRGHWDSYYRNIAETILGREELAVTAEQAREVVRVLDAAVRSSQNHHVIEGPWGCG
jgi:scyllo-inositol 2-dehydrogenase (NADP+)